MPSKENLYIVVSWPESQQYMDEEGFEDNSSLADCEGFGPSAYFINLAWLESIKK